MGLERRIKGWRSTIRTSHLNFSPPKPHACPHSDLYQASFTPSACPPSSPSLSTLSHPLLPRYNTRLTFATLTLFDCTTANRFGNANQPIFTPVFASLQNFLASLRAVVCIIFTVTTTHRRFNFLEHYLNFGVFVVNCVK